MRVRVNGPFRVFDDDGKDVTPLGKKERGLLALLLLSPGQRRTRLWLQDKLWSDRDAEQASGSLRQALSNVRKALGPVAERLHADRSTVWIAPEIRVDDSDDGELLDDIDVRDPEFSDWLRDQRMGRTMRGPTHGPTVLLNPQRRPIVVLRQTDHAASPRSSFLTRAMGQRIVGDLLLIGEMDVIQTEAQDQVLADSPPAAVVELESYGDDAEGYLLLRVVAMPGRRIVWSGRLTLAMTISQIWQSAEATRLVNQLVRKVSDLLAGLAPLSPSAAFHRAVRRIYEFDHDGLLRADDTLAKAQDGEFRGLALAWRSFIRLTSALEFRDTGPGTIAESLAFADEALQALADHPVVLSLASQVRLKLEGDLDAAHYLALRAAEISDQNPYALEALSQSLILHGDFEKANDYAMQARQSAQGLANSFNWDMQACLSALSLNQLDVAFNAALECHRKMTFYRPALRYLVALSYLASNREAAAYYTARLRRIEPDFTPALLLRPDYPLETLRALGYGDSLAAKML